VPADKIEAGFLGQPGTRPLYLSRSQAWVMALLVSIVVLLSLAVPFPYAALVRGPGEQSERQRPRFFVGCVQSYKKDSPSSGLFRVKVYNEHGMAERNGMGMFPRALKERFPLLPMEEEGRLNDMPLRENFIERVFAYQRWTQMLEEEPTPGGLVKFHTAHKLTLMAHSPAHYTEMGRLVARAGSEPWEEMIAAYGVLLMEGLSVPGTRGKHVNVLQHLMGYLKNELPADDKQELLGVIEEYRQGMVPLIVPLTLLKHHLRRNPVPPALAATAGRPGGWVWEQVYLQPYPKELMLRNHV
jgi:uncharacterized protein YbgA (DUF1722 family)